jgi:hypothetical protein
MAATYDGSLDISLTLTLTLTLTRANQEMFGIMSW